MILLKRVRSFPCDPLTLGKIERPRRSVSGGAAAVSDGSSLTATSTGRVPHKSAGCLRCRPRLGRRVRVRGGRWPGVGVGGGHGASEVTGRDTAERLALYLAHLHAVTGEDPIIEEVEPRDPSDGRVLSLGYRDVPGPGLLTGVTYGLSLSSPGGGVARRHEMVITLRSRDLSWVSVPARAVAALRGISPLDPGRAIGYAQRFVEESAMSSLLLGGPASNLGLVPFSMVPAELGGKGEDALDFVGVYPIYSSEREFAKKNGFKAFWELEWDRFDPLREPIV